MGTIAARDCLRILELTETIAAISLLASCQAYDLRCREAGAASGELTRSAAVHKAVRKNVEMLIGDRRQDLDIAKILKLIRSKELPIGSYTDV